MWQDDEGEDMASPSSDSQLQQQQPQPEQNGQCCNEDAGTSDQSPMVSGAGQ